MDLNNIKDQIKDFELDFDQNEVWSKIEQKQKKKSRKALFWLASLLGALLLIVGVFHWLDSSSITDEENIEISDNTDINLATVDVKSEIGELQNSVLEVEDNVTNSNHIVERNDGSQETYSIQKTIENEVQRSSESSISSDNAKSNLINDNQTIIETGNNQSTVLNAVDGVVKEITNFINSKNYDLEESIILEVENNSLEENKIYNNSTQQIITSGVEENGEIRNENKIDDVSRNELRDQMVVASLLQDLRLLPRVGTVAIDQEPLTSQKMITPYSQNNLKGLQLKFAMEYGLLKRNLEVSNVEVDGPLLANRESSEKVLDHFIAGLHLHIPLSNTFLVNGGLEYQRMNSQLNFQNTEIQLVDPDNLPSTATNSYGYLVSKSNNTYYNHLNLTNILIEFGSKWSINRFSQFVSLGTSLNVNTTNRQLYINEFQNVQDNKNIKSSLNNSYVLRTGLVYDLSSNYVWSVHASYRLTPNVNTVDSDFVESYQSFLLGTGIAYKF